MSRLARLLVRREVAIAIVVVALASAAVLAFTSRRAAPIAITGLATTVADVHVLHADVRVRERELRGDARLRDGDEVKTGPNGRARLRLDDGTTVVVDTETTLTLRGARLGLARGRVFVQAGAASRTEVALAEAVVTVVSAAAAFDAGASKIYCARGELVLVAKNKTVHVPSGETATLSGDGARVAPETAFDDWTGGLAVPWSGERAPASAIAELRGGQGADLGAPLVVRSEDVEVTVEGELAYTRTRTTYFNGSDQDVQADVRLALPDGAILARVARQDEGAPVTAASVGPGNRSAGGLGSRLEWAGGGWLRGTLLGIKAGTAVELFLDWVEWLDTKNGHATYRFPMASDVESPMVGGLKLRVASRSPARWLTASSGTTLTDGKIELRRADVRPSGDLVVEMVPAVVKPSVARAYLERGDGVEDPYLLVRTELPEAEAAGVALALVVDTSSSVGSALLETERAAVDAILDALGPKDAVVVVAADQDVRVVGADHLVAVTPEARAKIRDALARVRAGGASNLGLGLERAADLLDTDTERAGMVVYLGDGRPTVGEADARELKKRLSRRTGGVPRLGAFAIGQAADRWMLAELVAGAGPVLEVLDRPDAARAAASLVADALAPTLRDVSLALGATVDRVYPRDARTAAAGVTIATAGRLRGEVPKTVTLRYRRGKELVEEERKLELLPPPAGADIAKRWAALRIEESVTHADGVEPAVALASKMDLTTPWTGWYWDGNASAPWEDRLLGLSASADTAFAGKVDPAPPPPSLLFEPPAAFDGEDSIERAAEMAARNAIRDAAGPMIACRDARASIKPGITSDVRVDVTIGGDGRATRVNVAAQSAGEDDPVLDRCLRVVVASVPFFGAGMTVSFSQGVHIPQGAASRRTQCSVASTLPLPVRRGVWRARKRGGSLDYFDASRACELPTWSDRRALLTIATANVPLQAASNLATRLAAEGQTDAAAFVRQELLRRTDLGAGDELRRLLIADEPKVDRALDKAYRAARDDAARAAVLRRFLRLAPHSPLGRRLELALLERTGDRAALEEAVQRIREDVFADAGLVAECASILRRLGRDDEGRRAFGELIERAPRDPWTLGYVGDRLRAEGLHEDALAAYLRLDAAMPDDPAALLRLALAHAGVGRLDVATRLLDRVAQTGGRGDDGRLGELASIVSASLLASARSAPGSDTDGLLVRRLTQTSLPDVPCVILVRTPLTDDRLEVSVARREKDKDELPADLDAATMGLAAVRIERGGGTARIRLRRPGGLVGGRATKSVVTALVLGGEDRTKAKLVTREVEVAPGERGAELRWNGEVFE